MCGADLPVKLSAAEALKVLELAEQAISAQNLQELAEGVLPGLAHLAGAAAALLYLEDPRLLTHPFLQTGLPEVAVPSLRRLCAKQFHHFPGQAHQHLVKGPLSPQMPGHLALFPLRHQGKLFGLLGAVVPESRPEGAAPLVETILPILAQALSHLLERYETDRRIKHLNTYLTVSSMIAQSLGLQELLETVLYCCMEAVSAEAASVLLLDDDKQNFRFYSVTGPAREVLMSAALPADRGLSGYILNSQKSEVINDVQHDPRFYGRLDKETGFKTRNIIIIPLTAGEEKVGLLEVLNKAEGANFTEEERLLLNSIAEEIAFAIHNAKIFEYVVDSYCKLRQGHTSCEGCQRPLGSWTPCVKYRQEGLQG